MYKITGVALATVLGVTGCGGGGGSGPVAAAPTPTSVSGTAAKGIIKQARVLACRIVNGVPEADATCASTITGSDGSYRVTFSDGYSGPAMIKVMAGTSSTMMDETTGFDIPYNMTMRALVPAVSGATTAYVTPFSEMAVSAMGATAMDATKINQAIATVQSTMSGLGIDLSVMPMMDFKNNASNSTVLTMQANMTKQLSRVAMAAKNSSLLKDANGVACNTLATDSLKDSLEFSCVVTAMAGVMSNYLTADSTKVANMMIALNAQNVTNVTIPMLQTNGTLFYMRNTNMTSLTSMTTAMQNAGMTLTTAANTANTMMGGGGMR